MFGVQCSERVGLNWSLTQNKLLIQECNIVFIRSVSLSCSNGPVLSVLGCSVSGLVSVGLASDTRQVLTSGVFHYLDPWSSVKCLVSSVLNV